MSANLYGDLWDTGVAEQGKHARNSLGPAVTVDGLLPENLAGDAGAQIKLVEEELVRWMTVMS